MGAAADWTSHGGGADESGYSRLDQINRSNIGKLGLAWSLSLPGEVTLEATPLAINGVLYFTGRYAAVYAVDGVTGKLLWKYDPETWKYNPAKMHFTFGVNRGVAYADGRIFAAAMDGRLFSLDAKTGELLWSVETTDRQSVQTITAAPRTFKDKVIVGNGGGDFGARGYVTAYDARTGKQLWRFYTVPGDPAKGFENRAMELAAKTWSGEWWKSGGGGAVWNAMTHDLLSNLTLKLGGRYTHSRDTAHECDYDAGAGSSTALFAFLYSLVHPGVPISATKPGDCLKPQSQRRAGCIRRHAGRA